VEGLLLAILAAVLIDQGRYAEAIQHARESVGIGDDTNNPQISNWGNQRLALAHLAASDLAAARAAADTARGYDVPNNNHNVLALLGVIARRQHDEPTARAAFAAAIAHSDTLLGQTAQNYGALDTKALALCGLALIEGRQHLPAAITAYRAARAINNDAGVVAGVLRLFDALALADATGALASVRAAAEGKE
jgi:tetratricopeptide (TPR) repeat protein